MTYTKVESDKFIRVFMFELHNSRESFPVLYEDICDMEMRYDW